MPKNELKEAKIFSLAQVVDRCIVVVEEVGGPRLVPIWIGIFEGGAIAAELTGQEPPRPMTHDLMANIFKASHISMDKVVITDLRDNTYFAEIHLKTNGSTQVIDARPSDALALAVTQPLPDVHLGNRLQEMPRAAQAHFRRRSEEFQRRAEEHETGRFLQRPQKRQQRPVRRRSRQIAVPSVPRSQKIK